MSWLETALNGIAVQLKSLKENKLSKDEAFKIFQKKSDSFSGKWADLKGKPSLSNVATSGKYSDLSGVPEKIMSTEFSVAKTTVPGARFSGKIVYGNGVFVASGRTYGEVYRSVDGVNWT